MCRNIKTLFNFAPPATNEEIRASAVQFVRKISGSASSSKANEVAFDEVAAVVRRLLDKLVTAAPPKTREAEAAKARMRSEKRFGTAS